MNEILAPRELAVTSPQIAQVTFQKAGVWRFCSSSRWFDNRCDSGHRLRLVVFEDSRLNGGAPICFAIRHSFFHSFFWCHTNRVLHLSVRYLHVAAPRFLSRPFASAMESAFLLLLWHGCFSWFLCAMVSWSTYVIFLSFVSGRGASFYMGTNPRTGGSADPDPTGSRAPRCRHRARGTNPGLSK